MSRLTVLQFERYERQRKWEIRLTSKNLVRLFRVRLRNQKNKTNLTTYTWAMPVATEHTAFSPSRHTPLRRCQWGGLPPVFERTVNVSGMLKPGKFLDI